MNKEDLLKRFGKNVKIERIKRDLTQENCAELLDVTPTYFTRIENGRENMSLGKILELSQVLNFELKNLLNFED